MGINYRAESTHIVCSYMYRFYKCTHGCAHRCKKHKVQNKNMKKHISYEFNKKQKHEKKKHNGLFTL